MSCMSWATQSPHVQEVSEAAQGTSALGQGSQRGEPIQRGEFQFPKPDLMATSKPDLMATYTSIKESHGDAKDSGVVRITV